MDQHPDDPHPATLETRLLARLSELRQRRRGEDPAFNPIWRLASELSFALEEGRLPRDELCRLCTHLLDRSLDARGAWMAGMLAPLDSDGNRTRLRGLFEADAKAGFEAFAARWVRPLLGCVFTAHPTFLLRPAERARLLSALDVAGEPQAEDGTGALTLENEHRQALAAIANASAAAATVTRELLETARRHFPERWRELRPEVFDLATWVGYDMDGRTDIAWYDCIRLRLTEKAVRLGGYLETLHPLRNRAPAPVKAALQSVAGELEAAREHTAHARGLFAADMSDPQALAAAADWLSGEHSGRLTSLEPLLCELDAAIDAADGDLALDLAVLAATMRRARLGVARMHFRINATQVENAVRRRLDARESIDLASRAALARLNELAAQARALRVNFAALAVETTTAVRQFLAVAQILKHIDAESDIRLLIAECERPATVLAAVYFARLFGLEDRLDISPLFETPAALEGGERFLDVLLGQAAFRDAVRRRGRIAIQTGFSDAGRFIGQIPASLAIERLHANLARLVERHGLEAIECVVFDTHGESMGRGAHPCSLAARLDHVLTPWARARFARRGLPLRHEVSFQGGDGYLWFARESTALALFARILEHRSAEHGGGGEDPFYEESDISLDFYRRVMRFQESVMALPACHRTLSAFGLSLLRPTGSRKARRQFETGVGERPDLSKIRAIPHNAVLQQLGYPLNVVSGVGQAARAARELFADWRHESVRLRGLMDMVTVARARASLRTLTAYGRLFDGGYWAARPHGTGQAHLTEACLYLADRLEGDDRYPAAEALATRLRIDELLLHRLLAETGEDKTVLEVPERDFFALLHAVRIALVQHLFLLAARIPRFSARNDIGREDIMEMIFELRVREAVAALRAAYPLAGPRAGDFALAEPSDYPDETAPDYASLNRELIDPMEDVERCLLTVSVAVANGWQAHG